jgi:hypothetical protein
MKQFNFTFEDSKHDVDMPKFIWTENSVTMTGRAMPEFAIQAWVEFMYTLNKHFEPIQMKMLDRETFTVNFKLDFYNSASSIYITEMFRVLQSNWSKCDCIVNWYFFEADEDTEIDGEMYRDSNLYRKVKVNLIKRTD